MPYISKEKRDEIDVFMDDLIEELETKNFLIGDLAYILYRICLGYLNDCDYEGHFSVYNSVIGVLESVKLELYRKRVAPYEDTKIIENGAIYSTKEKNEIANKMTEAIEADALDYYMHLPYKINIEFHNDGQYFTAWLPELGTSEFGFKNVCGHGRTVEEALADLKKAKEEWFKECLASGIEIPEPNEQI